MSDGYDDNEKPLLKRSYDYINEKRKNTLDTMKSGFKGAYEKSKEYAKSFKSDNNSIFNKQWQYLTEIFTDPKKLATNAQTILIYVLLFLFVISLSVFFRYYSRDDNIYTDGFFFYMIVIVIPIILFTYYGVFSNGDKSATQGFFVLLGVIVLMYALFEIRERYEALETSLKKDLNMYLSIIGLAIGLVGMAMIFNLFSEKLKRLTGISGFIVNFIFFIPCIINDFFIFIKDQFYLTPSINYILLVVEILLVLAYVYIPRLLQRRLLENGKVLLNDPQFLDKNRIIATTDDIPMGEHQKYNANGEIVDGEKESRKNYAISLWTYMNINAPTQEAKHVFSYSSHPKIEYLGNDGNDKYNVQLSEDDSVQVDLDPQRWNYWVFNYNQNVADIFVNGKLVKSTPVSPNYSGGDSIAIGDKHLDGAICNITYHKSMLIESEIANNYNLLINKNPPVNNLI